eukprot:6329299-Pyramimonas_sp.AAC.1
MAQFFSRTFGDLCEVEQPSFTHRVTREEMGPSSVPIEYHSASLTLLPMVKVGRLSDHAPVCLVLSPGVK